MKKFRLLLFVCLILFYGHDALAATASVSKGAVRKGEVTIVRWSGFSGQVNIPIYLGSSSEPWVHATINGTSSGSQELDTTGWAVGIHKVRVEQKSNQGIYLDNYVYVSNPSISLSVSDLEVGDITEVSWSGYADNVRLPIYYENSAVPWVFARTNAPNYGSQNLDTTGWAIGRHKVRVELKASTNIYEEIVLNVRPLPIPPIVDIRSPSNGYTTSNSNIKISGIASDEDGSVYNVKVEVNSGSWFTATGTTSWEKNVSLQIGDNTITAIAYDDDGLGSEEDSITITRTDTYSWHIGNYGSCTPACGTSTKTRTVYCKNSAGNEVINSYCSGTKPSPSTSCNNYDDCTYRWEAGDWGVCNTTCGDGTRSRSVTCFRSDNVAVNSSYCANLPNKPSPSEACSNDTGCTYVWSIGNWSDCDSNGYGAGNKSREVVCKKTANQEIVADSKCESVKPPITEVCFDCSLCSYEWKITAWSKCDNTCGEGQKDRTVWCERKLDNQTVDDFYCINDPTAGAKREASEVCEDYSDCGVGYHEYFSDVGKAYGIPYNLLKAIAHVESSWDQSAQGGFGKGVMQLEEKHLSEIAGALISRFPEDYGSLTQAEMIGLLVENSDDGAKANIRGGAYWLKKKSQSNDTMYDHEPREALESWWFAVTAYNGGGISDKSLLTSNYPYRVYNCFLIGVNTLEDGIRVPKIPITLPPHFEFRKATPAELANGEVNTNDANLTPKTPSDFMRETWPFDACADMGYLHDNDGNLLDLSKFPSCDAKPLNLGSPLYNQTLGELKINSIFDYSSPDYSTDDYVINGYGEIGRPNYGKDQDGYMNKDGKSFNYNGQYRGAGGKSKYLYYDGHPGIDYQASKIAVLAMASGEIQVNEKSVYNTFYINLEDGYQIKYMHCNRLQYADNDKVKKGDTVAFASNVGTEKSGAHLHIEILKNGVAVDPYGWHESGYTVAVNSSLWEDDTGGSSCPNPHLDTDGDSVIDCYDICPDDPKNDIDNDGICAPEDQCSNDVNKVEPGQCGCNEIDTDTDSDGVADCVDSCPNDSDKVDSGQCGCGELDTDTDGDGSADCVDSCPNDPNKVDPEQCGCGNVDEDLDTDGVVDCIDNCPTVTNPNQADTKGDGIGDACRVNVNTPKNTPPEITLEPVNYNPGENLVVVASITDENTVQSAVFYYRSGNTGDFLSKQMSNDSDNKWLIVILAKDVPDGEIEYYISATDDKNDISNTDIFELRQSESQDAVPTLREWWIAFLALFLMGIYKTKERFDLI